MQRNNVFYLILILACTTVCVPLSYAQEVSVSSENEEIDGIIEEALDQVEGTVDKDQVDNAAVKVEHSEGEQNKTVVEIPVEVEVLDEIIISDDSEPEEALETKIIPLLHAEASGIIDVLNEMKGPKGEVMYNEEDSTLILKDVEEQLEAMTTYVKDVDIVLETEIFKLQYAKVQDVAAKVKGVLTKNVGQIQYDQRANSIVTTDTPQKIGEIKELISGLDFLNKKIQMETKILQIVLNDEHMMGVDWEAIVSDFQKIDFSGSPFGSDDNQLNLGAVSREDYIILLEALDTVGVVRDVLDDVIETENEIIKAVDILSASLREKQNEGSNSAEEDNTDNEEMIRFQLTPAIGQDDKITVSVKPEYVGQNIKTASDALTEIEIEDGDTIIIGSLFEEVMVESTWKIPLLGDLPLLGFVFRNQGEEPRKSEIITFVTVKTIEKDKR